VPGYGASLDAGSIGESFGDYLSVTVGLAAAKQYSWPVKTDEACVADWDSVSYTSTVPHCLRRLDTDLKIADRKGEVHFDGQIWSRALWDIRQAYVALGQDHGGVGHHAHRQPVPVCAGHLLLGGRQGDLRECGRA
jgi:hypothetical protein